MTPLIAIPVLVAGYLLGSIPSGYLAGRWLKGIDIRQEGSGSTGATNVLRVVGKGPALAVFVVDVLKGALAVLLATVLRLLPEAELLDPVLLEERRLSQPLAQVGLLERRSGLVGAIGAKVQPVKVTRPPLQEVLQHGSREFLDLAALLVLGCAIAATVQTLLPRSWLLAVGGAPTISVLSLMLLAVVVSVCSSVDAFLALGFAA